MPWLFRLRGNTGAGFSAFLPTLARSWSPLMRVLVFLFALAVSLSSLGQVATGRVLDSVSRTPVPIRVSVHGTSREEHTDSSGVFRINLFGKDTISFDCPGYGHYRLVGCSTRQSDLDLGDILLVERWTGGFVTYRIRKKGFLKRWSAPRCRYEPAEAPSASQLEMRCPNGQLRYTWTFVQDGTLQFDVRYLRDCSDH